MTTDQRLRALTRTAEELRQQRLQRRQDTRKIHALLRAAEALNKKPWPRKGLRKST